MRKVIFQVANTNKCISCNGTIGKYEEDIDATYDARSDWIHMFNICRAHVSFLFIFSVKRRTKYRFHMCLLPRQD